MKEPSIKYYTDSVSGQDVRLGYREWGVEKNDRSTLICLHGITHNSRVFDFLGSELSDNYRVICPDSCGRGLSDWLNEKLAYNFETYVKHSLALTAELGLKQCDWLGTSQGGITAIILASLKNSPVRKLVLNDIGPLIPRSTMHLSKLAGEFMPEKFFDFEQVLNFFRPIATEYGVSDSGMHQTLAESLVVKQNDGSYLLDYDPGIFAYTVELPRYNEMDLEFWEYWEKVTCPVLILHGARSVALSKATLDRMAETHFDMKVIDIPKTGHAPHLMSSEQVGYIRDFLAS